MPLTLLKLAFTRSGGTVSKTAWVLQVINYIKKNSKCSCRNCIKEGGEEVPEFEAVAVTPKAAAGGTAEMTAVPATATVVGSDQA